MTPSIGAPPRIISSAAATKLLTIVVLAVSSLVGCKKHVAPAPTPPPDVPPTTSGFAAICSGAKRSFASARKYSKHADGSPSKAVVFAKGLDGSSWTKQRPKLLEGWLARDYRAEDAELTACVDAEPTKKDSFTCSYYGASVAVHSRDYRLRIIENATGNVLVDEKFTGDARTFVCPATVNGSKDWYVDFDKRLYGELFALEPETTTPAKETTSALYAVCSGTPVPSAGKPGAPGVSKIVYFNDEKSSFSNQLPSGIVDAAREKDISAYTTVACITAKPEKKKRDCDFYDRTLELYDGEFEVVLREARTAKIIETKSFRGTSGSCPSLYTFDSARTKKWMSTIDPSFQAWAATLFGGRSS